MGIYRSWMILFKSLIIAIKYNQVAQVELSCFPSLPWLQILSESNVYVSIAYSEQRIDRSPFYKYRVLLLIRLNISTIHTIIVFLEKGISGKAYDGNT